MAAGRRERATEPGGGAGRQRGVQCGLSPVARSPHGCACHKRLEVTLSRSFIFLGGRPIAPQIDSNLTPGEPFFTETSLGRLVHGKSVYMHN